MALGRTRTATFPNNRPNPPLRWQGQPYRPLQLQLPRHQRSPPPNRPFSPLTPRHMYAKQVPLWLLQPSLGGAASMPTSRAFLQKNVSSSTVLMCSTQSDCTSSSQEPNVWFWRRQESGYRHGECDGRNSSRVYCRCCAFFWLAGQSFHDSRDSA